MLHIFMCKAKKTPPPMDFGTNLNSDTDVVKCHA